MSGGINDHPKLPAGFNADDHNGDDFDGAGTNWEVWPVYFETVELFKPVVLSADMLSVFDGCADYAPPCEDNTVVLSPEVRELDLKKAS